MAQTVPTSNVWTVVYRKLHRAWEDSGAFGPPPPVPIAPHSGRGLSNFENRQERWQQTVQWANEHGLQHLIRLAYGPLG